MYDRGRGQNWSKHTLWTVPDESVRLLPSVAWNGDIRVHQFMMSTRGKDIIIASGTLAVLNLTRAIKVGQTIFAEKNDLLFGFGKTSEFPLVVTILGYSIILLFY